MKLSLYADESGTHDDSGKQPGSRFPIIGGLVASPDTFAKLTGEWAEVLYRYEMPYFHANEWHTANSNARNDRQPKPTDKNPYSKWIPKAERFQFDPFILDLAKVIGRSGALPVFAGGLDTKTIYENKANGSVLESEDPKRLTIRMFWGYVMQHLEIMKPHWVDSTMTFFFEAGDKGWQEAVAGEHADAREKFSFFRELSFVGKKDMPHLPVQAADLIAFRYRQMTESANLKQDVKVWDPVDEMLFRETFSMFDQMVALNASFQSALDDAFKK